MHALARTIGIDYSGAKTPNASLNGLRVNLAVGDATLSGSYCERSPYRENYNP